MSPSVWRATFWVARKELSTSLRDRQTVVYSILIPLGLYPLIFWCLVQGALFVQGRAERTEVRVGVAAAAGAELPLELRTVLETAPGAKPLDARLHRVELEASTRALDADGARDWLALDLERAREAPDAVLWLPPTEAAGRSPRAKLFYRSTDRESVVALERVAARIAPHVDRLRERAAEERGRTGEDLVPFEVERTNVAGERDMLAYLLSFVLPMLLVVMCVLGAFFPAVDLTAGEKERSTAETTLLLPVPRVAVHQGKIVAVSAAAVLATGLNLVALGLSVGHLLGQMGGSVAESLQHFPFVAFVSVAPLALLFAFFVSAVLTGVASLAPTFREGQALLGPVQMLFIFPALVGVVPGVGLSLPLALVPVVNVVLAFRAMLQGQLLPLEYAVTALSLLLFGLLAVRVAVRLSLREDVQLAGETLSLRRLLRLSFHGS